MDGDEDDDDEEEEVRVCTGSCYEDELPCDQEQPHSQSCSCCCCRYDPFEEEEEQQQREDDPRIRDPSFALRKLEVMKCQMRKWRVERLQIESQARSLSLALQQRGVDGQEVLAKADPLILHYRAENRRLERRRDDLEDENRDLRETLAERDCCETQPCDIVADAREKILSIRLRALTEKKKLRKTICELRRKLEEEQENGSCSALNRLRAKLRELICERKSTAGIEQQLVKLPALALEKSLETMSDLTTSCEELKRENERLLAEVESLKKEIKAEKFEVTNFEVNSAELNELTKRVRSCEETVTQLRLQLAEKDEIINDLQRKLFAERRNSQQLEHDLDQMLVSKRALSSEIDAMKAELTEKDKKVSKLLRELRQSVVSAQGLSNLETELEQLRPELRELETQRDEMLDELSQTRHELSARNDQIIQLLEERDRQRKELKAQLEAVMQRHQNEINNLQHELSTSTLENENLKIENTGLLDKLKKVDIDMDQLNARLNELQEEFESKTTVSKREIENLLDSIEKNKAKIAKLDQDNYELSTTLKNCEDECKKLKDERNASEISLKELEKTLSETMHDNEAKQKEFEEMAKRANEATEALEKRNEELLEAKVSDEASKKQLEEFQNELEKRKANITRLDQENQQLSSALKNCENNLQTLTEERDALHHRLKEFEDMIAALRMELETTNGDIAKLDQEKRELSTLLMTCDNNSKMLIEERDALEGNLKEVEKKLVESNKDLDERKLDLAKLDQENRNLSSALKNCEVELKKLKEDKDALEKSFEEVQQKLVELSKENETKQIKLEEMTKRVNEAQEALEKANEEMFQAKVDDDANKKQLEVSRQQLEKNKAEIDELRKERNELKSALDTSETLVNNLRTEMETLKVEIGNVVAERDRFKLERANLSDELEMKERLLAELQTAFTSTATDKDKLERELGDLKWQVEKLRKDRDNESALMSNNEKQLELANAEIERLKTMIAEFEKGQTLAEAAINLSNKSVILGVDDEVKAVVDKPKASLETIRKESVSIVSPKVQNIRVHSASRPLITEESKPKKELTPKQEPKPQKEFKPKEDLKPRKDDQRRSRIKPLSADRSFTDTFTKPIEALTNEIRLQMEAVNRVRKFISYVEGKASVKPKMATEPPRKDKREYQSSSQFNDLFDSSYKLSETIFNAEAEIQRLNKESSSVKPDNRSQITGSQNQTHGNINDNSDDQISEILMDHDFDANAWLQSLTLTELAELHDRICLLTSHMIQGDDDGEDVARRDLLNTRVAALQRQIGEKQQEAAMRADAMNLALMREQAHLMRISNEMNRERELSLAARSQEKRSTPEATMCCTRDDCARVGCAGDFDPTSARRK